MKTKTFLLVMAVIASSEPAMSDPGTITLNVQNMNCAICPLTVKKALERVAGVQQVSVDYLSKTATVQFDDTAATTDKLIDATKAAGYPSTIKVRQ